MSALIIGGSILFVISIIVVVIILVTGKKKSKTSSSTKKVWTNQEIRNITQAQFNRETALRAKNEGEMTDRQYAQARAILASRPPPSPSPSPSSSPSPSPAPATTRRRAASSPSPSPSPSSSPSPSPSSGVSPSPSQTSIGSSPVPSPSPSPPPIGHTPRESFNDGNGSWRLVRRVKPGASWHPATDNLVGFDVYGNNRTETSNTSWSIKYDEDNFNEFLFKTGDGNRWMIMSRKEVMSLPLPARYDEDSTKDPNSNPNASIKKGISKYYDGSTVFENKTRIMYNRPFNAPEDPWLSFLDHSDENNGIAMLYGENSKSSYTNLVTSHNGVNVYIRYNPTLQVDNFRRDVSMNVTSKTGKLYGGRYFIYPIIQTINAYNYDDIKNNQYWQSLRDFLKKVHVVYSYLDYNSRISYKMFDIVNSPQFMSGLPISKNDWNYLRILINVYKVPDTFADGVQLYEPVPGSGHCQTNDGFNGIKKYQNGPHYCITQPNNGNLNPSSPYTKNKDNLSGRNCTNMKINCSTGRKCIMRDRHDGREGGQFYCVLNTYDDLNESQYNESQYNVS